MSHCLAPRGRTRVPTGRRCCPMMGTWPSTGPGPATTRAVTATSAARPSGYRGRPGAGRNGNGVRAGLLPNELSPKAPWCLPSSLRLRGVLRHRAPVHDKVRARCHRLRPRGRSPRHRRRRSMLPACPPLSRRCGPGTSSTCCLSGRAGSRADAAPSPRRRAYRGQLGPPALDTRKSTTAAVGGLTLTAHGGVPLAAVAGVGACVAAKTTELQRHSPKRLSPDP
jgi:hypothetical protein